MKNQRIALLILTSLLQLNCAGSRESKNDMIRLSPSERSSIVFFFKKDVSIADQEKFLDDVLSIEMSENRGKDLLPGMKSRFRIKISDYDGFAINFLRDSTEEQKEEVIERLRGSSLVHRVYRHVVPTEITDL